MTADPAAHQLLYGHEQIMRQLKSSFDNGKLHHAMIFAGLEGVGKETLAYQLIRYGLAYPQGRAEQQDLTIPETHKVFRQIEMGGHPNVKVITPVFDEKKQRFARDINLDALEGLNNFLRLAPTDGANRFILIHPADSLSRVTQNAILKILEEPPAQTYFILLTSQAGSLLPTIRSRCLVVPFEALTEEEFYHGMQSLSPNMSPMRAQELYKLGGGSLGKAIVFEDRDILGYYRDFCLAVSAWQEGDSQGAMQFAERTAQIAESYILDNLSLLWSMRLAEMIRCKARHTMPEALILEEKPLLAAWQRIDTQSLLTIHDQLHFALEEGEVGYLDKKLVILKVLELLSGMDSPKQAVLA